MFGCATSYRIPSLPEASPASTQVRSVCLLGEEPSIGGVVESSLNAWGGGLVGALASVAVEARERDELEEKLSFLQNELPAWAWETFQSELQHEITAAAEELSPAAVERLLSARRPRAPENGVLYLTPHFFLSSDQSQMRLTVEAELFSDDSSGKPTYRNRFNAEAACYLQLFLDDTEHPLPEKAIAALERAIETIAREMAELIVYDLQFPADGTERSLRAAKIVSGLVIREFDGRVWVRTSAGELISSPLL
jgi:hypothetical protein